MQTRSKSVKCENKLQTNNNALKSDINAEVLTGKTTHVYMPEVLTRSKSLESGNHLPTACDNSVSEDNNREVLSAKPNPLFISEISHHILHFLTLSDIKNCRLVCQQWNQVAETFQRRLSVVKIKLQRLGRFLETFPNAQQCKVFTCFQLEQKWCSVVWRQYKLVGFFEKWRHNLRELILFARVYGPGSYDLTPLIPSNLSKLKILTYDRQRIISIDKICNIRDLHLDGVSINITPGVILNTQEIHLANVIFLKDKLEIPNVLINPLLNFAVLKSVSFQGENMTLDLQGSHSLDVLRLDRSITVLNWETSMWEIKKKLTVGGYNSQIIELGHVNLKYKDLDIFGKHLNVSLLPDGIEKLKLSLHGDYKTKEAPRIYGQHKFPALTKLHLDLPHEIDFSTMVKHFKLCSNLTTLSVNGSYNTNILKTSSIPRNVVNLHVNGVRIILDHSLEIKYLMLHNYFPNKGQHSGIIEIAKGLHVKNLIWLRDGTFCGDRKIFHEERGNFIKSLIDLKFDNFIVGKFKPVDDSLFLKSYFFPLVDKQGMFYLFQHGKKGKAVSEREVEYLSKY